MKDLSHGHEHEFEAAPGLPEPLPRGERLLWQGAPDWRALARHAFHVRGLSVYFAAILGARALNELVNGGSAADAAVAVAWLLPVAVFALGMLTLLAYLSSKSTMYTITDRRVIMRVGIVLTLTFNLPFKFIASAGFKARSSDTGDIPLALAGKDKIAYVHLWPHARPWRVASPEPMLRCVPDAERVAALLTQAWVQATGGVAGTPASHPAGAAKPEATPRGTDGGRLQTT
jgi:Bacterial PH domain